MPNGDQLVALDFLGSIVNGDDADIVQRGTGGLNGLTLRALGHDGVGVAVDDEVNAVDLLIQVIGSIGLGAGIHAQVSQNDDDVGTGCPGGIHLSLDGGIHLIAGQEGQALDEGGIGLGLCLGSFQTDKSDLHAALINHRVGVKHRAAILQHIGADNFEHSAIQVAFQLGIAIVELMVADGCHIIARGVHHGDSVLALVHADIDGALAVVAGIRQDDLSAPGLIVTLHRSHLCIQLDTAMYVVGVQDDGFAIQRLRLVRPGRGHQQRQRHDHGQKQC